MKKLVVLSLMASVVLTMTTAESASACSIAVKPFAKLFPRDGVYASSSTLRVLKATDQYTQVFEAAPTLKDGSPLDLETTFETANGTIYIYKHGGDGFFADTSIELEPNEEAEQFSDEEAVATSFKIGQNEEAKPDAPRVWLKQYKISYDEPNGEPVPRNDCDSSTPKRFEYRLKIYDPNGFEPTHPVWFTVTTLDKDGNELRTDNLAPNYFFTDTDDVAKEVRLDFDTDLESVCFRVQPFEIWGRAMEAQKICSPTLSIERPFEERSTVDWDQVQRDKEEEEQKAAEEFYGKEGPQGEGHPALMPEDYKQDNDNVTEDGSCSTMPNKQGPKTPFALLITLLGLVGLKRHARSKNAV